MPRTSWTRCWHSSLCRPGCLDGAPLIARPAESPVGVALDGWLAEHGLTPRVVARCDDSALMKVFAQYGLGFVRVPTVIESDIAGHFGLRRVGHVPELSEPLYLIRPAGRHAHPLLDEVEASAAADSLNTPKDCPRSRSASQ